MRNKAKALYVHIPFCSSICPYCDFLKTLYRPNWAKEYLNRLKEEAHSRVDGLFSTLYVGGGTPSCLSDDEFESLLSLLAPYAESGAEWSIEANPESLSQNKIGLLAQYGVNRVSLGAQSCLDKSLTSLGRHHGFEQIKGCVEALRKAGITNINLDWMYGFAAQTAEDLDADIEAFLSLKVPHISAYSLILEQGTAYAVKGVKPLDDDAQEEYFLKILRALEKAGYERYEVSNFALPGYRCRHNLTYWRDEPYCAIGLGASGYEGGVRYRCQSNLAKYLKGDFSLSEEPLDRKGELEDFFLTNLRLCDGFSLEGFFKRFGFDFVKEYAKEIKTLTKQGLLEVDGATCRASFRGMELLDTVLVTLFRD